MEQLQEGLMSWCDMVSRHGSIVLIWEMNGPNELFDLKYVSNNISRYGYTAEEYLKGQVNWLELICEEDRKRVNQEVCQFLLRASGNLRLEFRAAAKSGAIVWLEADSCYVPGEQGTAPRVETVLRDITSAKTREWMLLKNQRALQEEIFAYMDITSQKSFKENLIDFIKEQRIETLLAAASEIYRIHAAVIGRDYYFYTQMTGPKEEEGIFYDVAEQRNFRRKINSLEEILDTGQRNVILSMQNPDIKISGVPIFYKNEYVATWVMCCLEERETAEILKILEFMRIMAEAISEYYSNHVGEMSAKGYAFERHRLQRKVQLQEQLLELYDEMEDKSPKEKLRLILEKAGRVTNAGRCTLYEEVPGSIYARCVSSWMTQEADWNQMERVMYDVQALPDPEILLKNQEVVVLDSIHIPSEWRDTMCDLYASAAVLLPIEWNGKKGFLSFQEIGQERVWEEECIWFFKEIKKIIRKTLLKWE